MSPFRTRLLQLLTPTEPSVHVPARGDQVEAWLRAQRDSLLDGPAYPPPEWHTVDRLLALYETHADTRTPLDKPLPEPAAHHPF